MKIINPNFVYVENKLNEARFFLNHLEKVPVDRDDPTNHMEATYYFSAFASSARSITFVSNKTMTRVPRFESWYKKKQDELRANRTAKLMIEIRNEIEKEGSKRIAGRHETMN